MCDDQIATYPQFWRYYLREHARPGTRAWHFFGTSLAIVCFLVAIAAREPWLVIAALVLGYAPAWFAHFAVEKNRPATFRYPLWSLFSDFRMLAVWLAGRLPSELAAAGVTQAAEDKDKKAGA